MRPFSLLPRICFNFISCLLAGLYCAPGEAWGPQGHRVAGTLTGYYLEADTRLAIEDLIGEQSLADASTWADRMRGNPSPFWQDIAGPYHYVTVPAGKTYAQVGAPRKGDAVTALRQFRDTLENPDADRVQKQLAFRFALHIIQDLHQPLHVGNGKDRGGNSIGLSLAGEGTNLHRVWDTSILASKGLSDRAWVSRLKFPRREAAVWMNPDPRAWIAESAELREQIYPDARSIGDAYLQKWLPTVERRIAQSAVRAAAYFNSLDF